MKVSEKAKELIGNFSTATEQTALSPTVAAFNLYCATREDLEDYIAELEAKLLLFEEVGNELAQAAEDYFVCAPIEYSGWNNVVLFKAIEKWVSVTREEHFKNTQNITDFAVTKLLSMRGRAEE